jgi:hypothetical protein
MATAYPPFEAASSPEAAMGDCHAWGQQQYRKLPLVRTTKKACGNADFARNGFAPSFFTATG